MAEAGAPPTAIAARRAEALAARLPPLLIAADRVAATVAQGVHGRRRVGQGDSFWQFRRYVSGDPINRIDWRQSAKSGRPAPEGWFLRETEWEAAQTVALWRNPSADMLEPRSANCPTKHERASLLLLALASLLLRGGERVVLMQPDARPMAGKPAMDRLARDLMADPADAPLPPSIRLPRHASVILISDFVTVPLETMQAVIADLAALPARGYLLQVLDPKEVEFPYQGRIRFRGVTQDRQALIPRAEQVSEAYHRRLTAHQEGLRSLCAAAGFGFGVHRTDHPPETALLTLYTALGVR